MKWYHIAAGAEENGGVIKENHLTRKQNPGFKNLLATFCLKPWLVVGLLYKIVGTQSHRTNPSPKRWVIFCSGLSFKTIVLKACNQNTSTALPLTILIYIIWSSNLWAFLPPLILEQNSLWFMKVYSLIRCDGITQLHYMDSIQRNTLISRCSKSNYII